MPLSEQEQRLLEEMERNLYRNDADFVQAVGGVRGRRPNYRAIVLGVLLAVAGAGALIAGVASQLLIIGVIGFALMFAGVLVAITPSKRGAAAAAPSEPSTAGRRGRAPSGGSFMDRMNERWDRRQDDQS
jgi:predicted lipid-binding transport protein (Tim44 family)